MNALARAPKSAKPSDGIVRHPKIRPNQIVQLQVEQRDGKGRLLVEAGTRGEAIEEMENLRGWWIVYYEALMLHWPTRAEDLRPAPAESPGGIHADRLIAVLRIIVRLIRDTSGERSLAEHQTADVMAILEYMTGQKSLPVFLLDTYQDFHPWCSSCGQSGECVSCGHRGKACKACAGRRVCQHCPRQAEGHRELLDYLAQAGIPAPKRAVTAARARAPRVKRAA